LAVGF